MNTHHSLLLLNSATLGRAAAVVGDGRRVAYDRDANPSAVDGSDSGFTTAARPLNAHFALLHACLFRLLRGLVRSLLRGKGRPLTGATEAARAAAALRNQISFEIGYRNHRVIERRSDMHNPVGDILLLFLTKDLLFSACFCHILISEQLAVSSEQKSRKTAYR